MESTNRRRRRQKGYPCNALRLLIRIWGIITSTGKTYIKFKQILLLIFDFPLSFVRLFVSTCSVVCVYRIIYIYTEHLIYNQIYIYMKSTLILNVYIYQIYFHFSLFAFDFVWARARFSHYFILFLCCFVFVCACVFSFSVSTVFDFVPLCSTVLLTLLFVRLFVVVIVFRIFFRARYCNFILFFFLKHSFSLALPLFATRQYICMLLAGGKEMTSWARWEILIKQIFQVLTI